MDHRSSSDQGDASVHVQVAEINRQSEPYSQSTTIFVPQTSSIGKGESSAEASMQRIPALRAPEKKLTLFALRLAVIEKTATGLGTLGFVWATVVLLGGFAITLEATDFWFITIILLIEGSRIFGRTNELKWQHQAIWSSSDTGISSLYLLKSTSKTVWNAVKSSFRSVCRAKIFQSRQVKKAYSKDRLQKRNSQNLQTRRRETSDVSVLPYTRRAFLSRNVSEFFQWLQVLAAIACVVLSLLKLIRRDFGEAQKGDTDKRNRKAALLIFYSLALAEALLFLLEKIYWELKVMYFKVLEKFNEECELDPSGIVAVKRFFYEAYSRCVEGSIFDGLKMDMVSFAIDLLDSTSPDEQLMGAQILRSFSTSDRYSADTLQKIGVTFSAVERLVEILNWKDPQDEEIRHSAAEILAKLASNKQNSLRVAGIPGAMESISSLLYVNSSTSLDEIGEGSVVCDREHYDLCTLNYLGLVILKKLARDYDNCGKMGNTRGLLSKIVKFTQAGERLLTDDNATPSQIMTVKKSLQVIKMLASTTGASGKQLREEISEIVFTISNVRDILRHGEKHPDLQKLGIDILKSLAMGDDATERIGGTGGILKHLLIIFLADAVTKEHEQLRSAAGEALAMLALGSKENCRRILSLGVLKNLVQALDIPLIRGNAAMILRNLCTYSTEDCFSVLKGVTAGVRTILKGIVSEDNTLKEVMVGLAARAFKFMTSEESSNMFKRGGVSETAIADVLVQLLKKHQYPDTRFARTRRFTIELAIWMMKDKETNIIAFKDLGLQIELENVLDTTSEIESFNTFSGTMGLIRYRTTMHSLVETALSILAKK